MAVEDFDWLRVALHAPVVDGVVRDQGYCVERDPLPEGHVVSHGVSLHLALHLDVENLQRLCGWKEPKSVSGDAAGGADSGFTIIRLHDGTLAHRRHRLWEETQAAAGQTKRTAAELLLLGVRFGSNKNRGLYGKPVLV